VKVLVSLDILIKALLREIPQNSTPQFFNKPVASSLPDLGARALSKSQPKGQPRVKPPTS
jgi:hypothetical protein